MFQIDLVAQCKANDRKAQLTLYKQYCEGMFIVAMRFVKNEDDAEDVLQDAFIKAFEKIDQYRGDVTFGAWLKRIVVNRCLDFLKARRENLIALDERYLQVAADGDWTVADEITIDEVIRAMQHIPEKYATVVRLYLVEGYDHDEISGILDISGSACRTRLLRGKGYLKEILKNKRDGSRS
jgi:RNA polymerase sigma-70 factor (ECF subfamily)